MSAAVDRATVHRVLDLPLPEGNDAGAATVRDYLVELLSEVWRHEAGFNSKRPFGNSGWQHDLYAPMVRAGLTPGTFDEYDELGGDFDYRDADKLVLAAIAELGKVAV
jgi:hypothetical protein